MLLVLILSILFALHPSLQNQSAPADPSSILTTQCRWFRDRQTADKVVLPPRPPSQPLIDVSNRTQRADGTKVERDPNLDKIENRSTSLDQIGEQSSETPRVEGFTYEVKFKNVSPKETRTIFWEYQFREVANPENVSRHRFVCGVRIKADQDKRVQVFSTLGPNSVINVKSLTRGSSNQFLESIVIDRIEFMDGSVSQRQHWEIDEAQLAVARKGDRTGICRSF